MILIDTSAWIDLFSGKSNALHVRVLKEAIQSGLEASICGLILGEVLQGFRIESEYRKVLDLFGRLPYLETSRRAHVNGAEIYRSLRRRGVTVRGLPDCLIAATAIEHRALLLHNDRDFEPIAIHCGLRVHSASRPA